jgi:hypothetical protein
VPPWELEHEWAYWKEHALVYEEAELRLAHKQEQEFWSKQGGKGGKR